MSEQTLSPRQLQILRLAADGKRGAEIAREMHIDLTTVKTHSRTGRERLGARNTTQAVAIAIRRGLLDPTPTPSARTTTGGGA